MNAERVPAGICKMRECKNELITHYRELYLSTRKMLHSHAFMQGERIREVFFVSADEPKGHI